MKFIPRLPDTNVNVPPTSPLRDFLGMLGGLVALFVAIYILLGLTVDFMVPRLSTETEKLLGEYFKKEWSGTAKYKEQEEQLQEILDRIQQCGNLPYQLEIKVGESDMINAMALPGGRIVVLTGLLEKVRSENELSFVLAHEMGHFANRDHLSELGRGLVFMALSISVFGPNSYMGKQVGKLLQVPEKSFSRKHETMADAYALEVQNCFYGHVAGATDFFKYTARLENNNFTGHYLSSHPQSQIRITRLNHLALKRGYDQDGEKVPLEISFPERKKSGLGG